MRPCPDCGNPLHDYPAVLFCSSCRWHQTKVSQKRKRTDADAEDRRRWQQFSFTPEYTAFQHAAMIRHLRATPAIDRVYFSAHDAFGNPEGAWVMIAK